jgi:hypothetical protein
MVTFNIQALIREIKRRNKLYKRISIILRCRSLWSSGYHTYHWTQGLWVQQTRPRPMDFQGRWRIRNTTSFGGKVKPSAPRRKILHVKDPCGVWERYFVAKFKDISRQLPASILRVSAAAESSGGWIRSDKIRKRPQCTGCFVRYHPATVTSNQQSSHDPRVLRFSVHIL